MALPRREHERHWLALTFRTHMHLGAEAALRAAKDLALGVASRGPSSMLMSANDGTIHKVQLPVEPTILIRLLLQGIQNALPEPLLAPAIEAAGEGGEGAIALRDVTPGSTSPVKPQEAIDHSSMIDERFAAFAAFGRTLGWEERLQSLPLVIGQVMSTHDRTVYRVCEQTLAPIVMYHAHHNSTKQVGKGLLGAFIIEPKDRKQDPAYDLEYTMIVNDQRGASP